MIASLGAIQISAVGIFGMALFQNWLYIFLYDDMSHLLLFYLLFTLLSGLFIFILPATHTLVSAPRCALNLAALWRVTDDQSVFRRDFIWHL